MNTYRITKYNPEKRNSLGYYTDDNEWTAISDISNPKYDITYDDYIKIEDGYAFCVNLLKAEFGATEFIAENVINVWKEEDIENYKKSGRLRGLEVEFNNDVKPVVDGMKIPVEKLEYYCRLCLRDIFQLKLLSPRLQIEFGFDYYMYATCDLIPEKLVKEIERNNLFVERDITRMKVKVE